VPNHAHDVSGSRERANVIAMTDDDDREAWAPNLDPTLRQLMPRTCVGYREREPRRLQLRFVIDGNEHMYDIVVNEDDDSVVVHGEVCSPTTGACRDQCDVPFHVYLDQPLGERRVVDALSGREIPYRDVWAELAAEEARDDGSRADAQHGCPLVTAARLRRRLG
jgi:hypothetical protein